MNKSFPWLLSTGFLFGCATVYQQHAEGKLATISVPKFETEYHLFGGFSSGSVQLGEKEENGCGKLALISDKKVGTENSEVNIPANKELLINIARAIGNSSCVVTGSFIPEPGKKYRVLFGQTSSEYGVGLVEVAENAKIMPIKLKPAVTDTLTGRKACVSEK